VSCIVPINQVPVGFGFSLKKKKEAVLDKLYEARWISQKLQNETANKMEDNIRSD